MAAGRYTLPGVLLLPDRLARACLGGLLLNAPAACGASGSGPVVTAPSMPAGPPAVVRSTEVGPANDGAPVACGQSWALEDAVGAGAQVIVVCGSDVHRVPIQIGAMTRALDPALDASHERVCSCAARMAAPAFVDLVVTALPDEGHASVEPAEPDASLDPQLAQSFAACVGTFVATFPAFAADACGFGGKTKYVYSLDVELGP